VFFVLCFVFCALCFVLCVLFFVFCFLFCSEVTFFERCSHSRFWIQNPGARGKAKCLPVGGCIQWCMMHVKTQVTWLLALVFQVTWLLVLDPCLVSCDIGSRASLVPAIHRVAVSKLLSVERWSGGPRFTWVLDSWTPGAAFIRIR
jgi:hypothetical protein